MLYFTVVCNNNAGNIIVMVKVQSTFQLNIFSSNEARFIIVLLFNSITFAIIHLRLS